MNGTVGTSKVEDVKCLPGKTKRFKLFTVKVYKFSFKADQFTFKKTKHRYSNKYKAFKTTAAYRKKTNQLIRCEKVLVSSPRLSDQWPAGHSAHLPPLT